MKPKIIENSNSSSLSTNDPDSLVDDNSNRVEIEEECGKKPLEAIHNLDDNTIEIVLKSGEELTIREPRGKDFLSAEAWISQADEDRRSESFLMIKLALVCATFRRDGKLIARPSMEDFLDMLDDYESIEKVVKAIGFFRECLEDYFNRLKVRAIDMGMELPK